MADKVLEAMGGCFMTVATVVVGTIYKAFVLSILWGWFAVPLGMPKIGLAQAVGIALIVAMLAKQLYKGESSSDGPSDPWDVIGHILVSEFAIPTVFLAEGWVFHFFM